MENNTYPIIELVDTLSLTELTNCEGQGCSIEKFNIQMHKRFGDSDIG